MASGSWQSDLSTPIEVGQGRVLRTLADARSFASTKAKSHISSRSWQIALGLIMTAAITGKASDIAAATDQIYVATILENLLRFM